MYIQTGEMKNVEEAIRVAEIADIMRYKTLSSLYVLLVIIG